MNVTDIFDDLATRMRADLELARKALTHPGAKGGAFEESLRGMLRTYLPRSLDVSTGFIVDSTGGVSRQLDVIISDADRTPIFYRSGDLRILPVECVYAVIEVKARIDASSLTQVWPNLSSVKALRKRAFYVPDNFRVMRRAYGKDWDAPPVHYFVFAFESGDLMQLAATMRAYHLQFKLPPEDRIATICVLDRGVITNEDQEGMIDALPGLTSNIKVTESKRSLLLFYTLLAHHLFQADMPPFRLRDYLGQMEFGGPNDRPEQATSSGSA